MGMRARMTRTGTRIAAIFAPKLSPPPSEVAAAADWVADGELVEASKTVVDVVERAVGLGVSVKMSDGSAEGRLLAKPVAKMTLFGTGDTPPLDAPKFVGVAATTMLSMLAAISSNGSGSSNNPS